ncbi:MAG: class I SAM-dependent methyltransferase [Cyanobacteriota bacterium]|nr:class I SAM-dependent methyltransferase [Cyanobacteriota bacterium]
MEHQASGSGPGQERPVPMTAQTPAHDTANPDLLAILPAVARLVEVGCGTGALARAYHARQPRAHWLGIDIEPTYAELARRHCQEVMVGDVERMLDDPELTERLRADCWIFGDSLEHLRDPWRVLRQVHGLLTPGGSVCACIPNAQHWSVQARLCLGQFVYEDSGLLDRTHLRWFTPSTMTTLFVDNGYRIIQRIPRIFPHPAEAMVLKQIHAFAQRLGGNPEQAVREARPLQLVIRAERC